MTSELNNISSMKNKSIFRGIAGILAAAAGAALLFLAVAPAAVAQTPTMIVLRAMPKNTKRGEHFDPLPPLTQADIAQIKVHGKVSPVVSITPLLRGPHVLQLMVLLDSEQMLGANGQFEDLETFLHSLPSNVQIGLGWLLQGQVRVVQGFTTDRSLVYKKLIPQTREEASDPKNDNGNPYSCLQWLSSHWPDASPDKLRAVLVFTDGIIRGNSVPQGGDQLNPDALNTAMTLELGSIQPFLFFWQDPIPPTGRSEGGALEGQDLFSQVVTGASGAGLYEGMFAPGSLTPLLNRLFSIMDSETVVTVDVPSKAGKPGKAEYLDIKSARDDIKMFGPNKVVIGNIPLK